MKIYGIFNNKEFQQRINKEMFEGDSANYNRTQL
jgi:hypothetical protein